jgi:hypothetical protein
MIDHNKLQLFIDQYKSLAIENASSNIPSLGTLGIVVNTDDPLEQGRLQIFCPSLNDDPKKILYLPWCVYLSPYAGSIDNKTYARGVGDGTAESEGAIHYGFWGIPELGAHVLVTCVDGDPRRRIWLGCVPEHQETHTQFHGRYDWSSSNGTPDGPLTSDKKPIQPLYDNMTAAFMDRKTPEWKSRGADYQATSIPEDGGGSPNPQKGSSYLDNDLDTIQANEQDASVKPILGEHGYNWSGFKSLGDMKASRVFGMSTPGMHSITMDDRPYNNRMRFRSSTGHQILLDDTNERIYVSTNKGKSWMEMDSNGNVDIFSDNRISLGSTSDINLTSGGTIRLYAAESIHLYAGHNTETGQIPAPTADGDPQGNPTIIGQLSDPPVKGEIRIHAQQDLHSIAQNQRHQSIENTYHDVGITHYHIVGDSHISTVQNDISISTVTGDHILSSGNNIHATSTNDTKHYAKGKTSVGSFHDAELQSFSGSTSLTGNTTTKIKSMNSHVDIQAGAVSGSGSVKLITTTSQHITGDNGIQSSSSGPINATSGQQVTAVASPGFSLGMGDEVITGLGLSGNISIVGLTDIHVTANLGDIIHQTMITGHSYNTLSDKVNQLATGLDLTTYQLSLVSTATNIAIDALSGSFSIPFSFNLGCLVGNLFGGLPSELTSIFGSLAELNAALTSLGHAVTTLEGMASLLNGNTSLLSLLGLPTGLSLPSFGISTCVTQLPVTLGGATIPSAGVQTSESLRSLINNIYQGGVPLGTPPALSIYNNSQPCPLSIG